MNAMSETQPTVAIIVPAYNAEATLTACLDAIAALTRKVDELIVYDDGSTDRTNTIATLAGARVIRNDSAPRGPAYGRNAAARVAESDVLLFVDADVVIAPDALERMLADMLRAGAGAAFGSYDDQPRSQRATSLYANLRHHFVHQNGARDATTFWSGMGMIDRRVFLDIGGYDAVRFAHPSIEDIELGVRLIADGHRIRLVPEALGKHCKDWSLWRVWHTDIVRRAYPWSCLIADKRTAGADLNVSTRERITAALALAVPRFVLAALWHPSALLGAGAALAAYLYCNRVFFRFLASRLSLSAWLVAVGMHWCYHIYATATFVIVMLGTKLHLRHAHLPQPSGTCSSTIA